MKRLALCLFVSAAAACGGSSKSTGSTMPKSDAEPVARAVAPDCRAVADHMAAGDANYSGSLEMRCRENQWSDETRQCLAEKDADSCALTDEQKASIVDARAKSESGEEGRMGKKDSDRAEGQYKMKKEAPPEAEPRTRGAVKKKPAGDGKTADPCEGGE